MTEKPRTSSSTSGFRRAIETWVEKEPAERGASKYTSRTVPHDIVEQMKELGLFGSTIGEESAGGAIGLDLRADRHAMLRRSVWLRPHLQLAPDRRVASSEAAPRRRREVLPRMPASRCRAALPDRANAAPTCSYPHGARLYCDHYVVRLEDVDHQQLHAMTLLLSRRPDAKPRHKGMMQLIAARAASTSTQRREGYAPSTPAS